MDKCPDCKGELESGCKLDHAYGATLIQRYAKAAVPKWPQGTLWNSIETDISEVRRVVTYRCTKCNRLFDYAQDFLSILNDKIKNRNTLKIVMIVLAICGVIYMTMAAFIIMLSQ